MIQTTDTLEIQIAKAKALLSQDSRNAIDAVNWKQIIQVMNKKYTALQLETLETETELLLCGLVSTIDFPKELEGRMKIPKVEISILIGEMDRLIFKKMQEELEKRLNNNTADNKNVLDANKVLAFDLRFASLPKDIQESIAYSNWKEKLYDTARKYKINVEQMGILEDITVKVMLNTIAGNQYEDAIRSKIDLGNDKIKEIVGEINENIFKNIKRVEEEGIIKSEKPNDTVPLPPYAKKKEEIPLPPPVFSSPPAKEEKPIPVQSEIENIISNKELNTTKETDMYKEHGIEIISDDEFTPPTKEEIPVGQKESLLVEPVEKIVEENKVFSSTLVNEKIKLEQKNPINENIAIPEKPKEFNIITDKLFGNTASSASVSDYSLPKMGGGSHDPYHEEI